MPMGRRRQSNPLDLPPRVYLRRGKFYYAHRDGRWEPLGTDLKHARDVAARYNDVGGTFGTMAWWLDAFVADCRQRVGLPRAQRGLAPRTVDDHDAHLVPLKAYFGQMTPEGVAPHHCQAYINLGATHGRAVRANREMATFRACFSWLIATGKTAAVVNPAFQQSGVRRNPEAKRERYVEDSEFAAVLAVATSPQVRAIAGLIYRTLQRPADIQKWSEANIKTRDGVRILQFVQSKTKKLMSIRLTPEIEALLELARGGRTVQGMTFIHRNDGRPYAEKTLSAMWAGYRRQTAVEDFSIYDLKGKGATDMYVAGVPLEQIRELCGHASVRTTEIYIKARLHGIVEPNLLKQSMTA